jgi:putative membrane protein
MRQVSFSTAVPSAVQGLLSACAAGEPAEVQGAGESFVRQATMGNRFGVMSSELALRKSSASSIISFAERIIADHRKFQRRLREKAGAAGLEGSPEAFDPHHQALLNALRMAQGRSFDIQYVAAQREAQDNAVRLFRNYSAYGGNASLRRFAAEILPVLVAHRRQAYGIEF